MIAICIFANKGKHKKYKGYNYMAKLEARIKENPKLSQRTLSDGRKSLFLEYYLGRSQTIDEITGKIKVKHYRKKEVLNLHLISPARTTAERQTNKETLELAQKIRAEREQELKNNTLGYRLSKSKNINFLDLYQSYIDNYTKSDTRQIKAALTRFKAFLGKHYPIYQTVIKPAQLSKEMMTAFVEYLESVSKGEGALTSYKRFKKVVKYIYENGYLKTNPCNGVVCKIDNHTIKKDVLSEEEMLQLVSTKYHGQNPEIRRAFIFCLYTGIRFCDVIDLTYKNVDYPNRRLTFEQNKTKGHSAASGVSTPLNEGLISLIGDIPNGEDKGKKIFKLPSQTMCLKALKTWTKKAGIDKHITWHCARHSFAVNILSNGANIKTVASLLGHSGLTHTEKYTRAVDSLKEAAINSLPTLNI